MADQHFTQALKTSAHTAVDTLFDVDALLTATEQGLDRLASREGADEAIAQLSRLVSMARSWATSARAELSLHV